MKKKFSIAVVGGGIGGCMAAIKASELENVEVHLFEKKDTLLSGLPFCHLHSGGFLYPMITLDECIQLLNHSLEFADFFSDCIDLRPTVVAYRNGSSFNPRNLIDKCRLMKDKYLEYCETKNDLNKFPLGDPECYYAIYTLQDILYYKKYGKLNDDVSILDSRKYHDPYVEKFYEIFDDIYSIRYPLVSVMEPTILMDRVYDKINKLLNTKGVFVHLNTKIDLENIQTYFDHVVNACGFENSMHSNNGCSTNLHAERYLKGGEAPLLELKSSWIIRNDNPKVSQVRLPEIAIIGERGTENGMIQISQCEENNVFQIHVMTNDCTIFDCVDDINKFSDENRRIVYNNKMSKELIDTRTKNGINRISKLFSCFENSQTNSEEDNFLSFKNTNYKMPCWGVQRIVSKASVGTHKQKNNRVADIIFPNKNYSEIQIIKGVSSVTASEKLKDFLEKVPKLKDISGF